MKRETDIDDADDIDDDEQDETIGLDELKARAGPAAADIAAAYALSIADAQVRVVAALALTRRAYADALEQLRAEGQKTAPEAIDNEPETR